MNLTPDDKAAVEDLMDALLGKMNDKELEGVHQVCVRRTRACEEEIARRKAQRTEQERGFAV